MVLFTPTYSPFSHFDTIHHDSPTLFTFPSQCTSRNNQQPLEPRTQTVQPVHSFKATEEGIQLEVELPGVAKEHTTIEVKGRKISIRGKRFKRSEPGDRAHEADGSRSEKKDNDVEKKDGKADVQGRPAVEYRLTVGLGEMLDTGAVRADSLQDGVLMVCVPFKKPQTRHIEIA